MKTLEALSGSFDPGIIAAALVPEKRVATGNDSEVFRVGGWAVKRYSRISSEAAVLYAAIMNRAVKLVPQIGYTFRINLLGRIYDVDYAGVLVEHVFKYKDDHTLALSRFIPEPNLDRLTASPAIFRESDLDGFDAEVREFFFELNKFFSEEFPTRVRDEFEFHTSMLSRLLDFELGTFGLYIGKYNVKIVPNLERGRITLAVTDIAVYIPRVAQADAYRDAVSAFRAGLHGCDG